MKGKIVQWRDDKGFGFIQPENGSEKLFFHVSSIKTNARRPEVGDTVLYASIRDSQQRLKAKSVVIEGVAKGSQKTPKRHATRIDPPKKNVVDYFAILVALLSLCATGLEFYRTNDLGNAWPFAVPAVIAFFFLMRQKIPADKSFYCSGCRKVADYDSRTIQAWNDGITRLYCKACHHQWLQENLQQKTLKQNRNSGCLSVMALMIVIPILSGVGLYQWFV